MFENKDYIALSLSDDSIRKKSFKRVNFWEFSTSEFSYQMYYSFFELTITFWDFPAMEPALEISKESPGDRFVRSCFYDIRFDSRTREATW